MSTVAGFLSFIRLQMGISTTVLPDSAQSIADAYALAGEVVNPAIQTVSAIVFDLATYNLAGDNLINNASDQVVGNASITWAGGVATVTTSAPHGYVTGTTTVISGTAPAAYSGTVSATVTGASTYTFALTANPGTCTQAGASGLTFFADLRKAWNITGFVAGVISSSADVSTSESLLVPKSFEGLTIGDLQNLKTPYGRQYLAYAQRYGSLWDMS